MAASYFMWTNGVVVSRCGRSIAIVFISCAFRLALSVYVERNLPVIIVDSERSVVVSSSPGLAVNLDGALH